MTFEATQKTSISESSLKIQCNLTVTLRCRVQDAASNGAALVVLPEMWNCPYSNDSFPTYAEDIESGASPSVDMLSAAARQCRVTLVAGTVPERAGSKLYNTCCVFGTDGELLGKHR